jgi:DNA-directed RNA polymerase III subunit RPC1
VGEDPGLESTLRRFFHLHALKKDLPDVIIKGVPSISRAIINEEINKEGKKEYYLLLEGYGLAEVMGASGVNGPNTKSNHIIDMQRVLGIEAARSCIADEIKYIMSQYGIVVDVRHLMLLSDVMTFRGEVGTRRKPT